MRTASIRHFLLIPVSALLILLAMTAPVVACLQYYATDLEGHRIELRGYGPPDYIRYLTDHKHESYDEPDEAEKVEVPTEYKARSDYAADLVHKGKYDKAIDIFEDIEKSHPGEYIVAANLGTAYELSGNNEKALQWISEGIKRNAKAHLGTEWLHVKILEAKLALTKDPDWLKTHSVLGLNFENEARPKMPWQFPEGQDLKSVQAALEYQLHERLEFVKPPEPIVGELLGDLANIVAQTKSVEHAQAVYELALTYKPVHSDILEKRRDYMRSLIVEQNVTHWGFITLLIASPFALYVAIRWLMSRSRKPAAA